MSVRIHLVHPAFGTGIPRHACRRDHASWATTTQGQMVTCKSCRRTTAWADRQRAALRLHEKVEHAARRGDWPRDRQRIERLFGAWPTLGRIPPPVLVALDRYEETPPEDRDPAALAMELAPVHPGWLS